MSNVDAAIQSVNRLFTDVFRDAKLAVADEVLTKDFRFQYPFPGFPPGPEGIKEFTKVVHGAFPGFQLEIHDLFGTEGKDAVQVAIRWTLRGHHKGDFLGAKASGNYVTVSAIGVYMTHGLRSPLLASGWLEMDTLGLLQQMKVVSPLSDLLPSLRGKA